MDMFCFFCGDFVEGLGENYYSPLIDRILNHHEMIHLGGIDDLFFACFQTLNKQMENGTIINLELL